MIWDQVHLGELYDWLVKQQRARPPQSFELVEPPTLDDLLHHELSLRSISGSISVHPQSGAIDVSLSADRAWTNNDVAELGATIARAIDDRKAVPWRLDEAEDGYQNTRHAVATEFGFFANAIPPVGPGGRMTYYPRRRLLEIVVRRRGRGLYGDWRNPTNIADRVSNFLDLAGTPSARLRAAFGYYEASKYVSQSLLRPVFLFLLDRPTAEEGPRWRVSTVEAATELPEIPPTAGLDFLSAGCA